MARPKLKCPKCGSTAVGEIAYGETMPSLAEDEGHIVFGGCCDGGGYEFLDGNNEWIWVPSPQFLCHQCYYEWHPKDKGAKNLQGKLYELIECPYCGEFAEHYEYQDEDGTICLNCGRDLKQYKNPNGKKLRNEVEKIYNFQYDLALKQFLTNGKASAKILQSKLGISPRRSFLIMNAAEEAGLIGRLIGEKPRKVYAERIWEYLEQNKTCPKCGSSNVAKYLYGNVILDDKLEKEIREKKIILGGCDVVIEVDPDTGEETYPPEYRCNKCKTKWGGRHA